MKQENNKLVTISAPGKLLVLGDHAVVYSRPCLVTAVNYRVFAEVSLSHQDEFIFPEGTNDHFVKTALTVFRKKFSAIDNVRIKTWAGYKESYGLGSSSAVTVSVVKAFSEIFSVPLTNKELFDICYEVVLAVQKVGSGFDIAAAIYGGTLYFVTGGRIIEPLSVLPIPLVVAYSGSKGNTPELVKRVKDLRETQKEKVESIFAESESLVMSAKELLMGNNYEELGKRMSKNHQLLQRLGVSTLKLNKLVTAAEQAGAYGAKLSGAGGGDCIIALVSSEIRTQVEQTLTKAGGTIIPVTTHEEGVRIEQ